MAKKKKHPAHYPPAPSDLTEVGADAWLSVCTDLDHNGTLASTDRKLIEVYCRDYALLKRCEFQLAGEPLSFGSPSGRVNINPLVSSYNTLSKQLRQTLSSLGLTPKSRGAKPTDSSGSDPYKDLIGKGDI